MNQRVKEKILSHFDAALRRDVGLLPRKLILNLHWKFRNNPISFTHFPEKNMTIYVEHMGYLRYLFTVHSGIERIDNWEDLVSGDRACQWRAIGRSHVRDVMCRENVIDDARQYWEYGTFLTAGYPTPVFCNEQPLFLDSSSSETPSRDL